MKGKSVKIHQQLVNLGIDLNANREATNSSFLDQEPVSNFLISFMSIQGSIKLTEIKEKPQSKVEKLDKYKFDDTPDTFYSNLFCDKIQSKQFHGMMEIKYENKAYFPGETVHGAVCFTLTQAIPASNLNFSI